MVITNEELSVKNEKIIQNDIQKEKTPINDLKLRPMNFNKDYDQLIQLFDTIFQNELHSKGITATSLLEEYKKILPLFKILGMFKRAYRHVMDGFVYTSPDNRIVSTIFVGYTGDSWEISMVATDPDYRNRGLAKNLVKKAINHTKKHGGKSCHLEVLEDNIIASSLYRKIGFVTYDQMTKMKITGKNIFLNESAIPEPYTVKTHLSRNSALSQGMYDLALKTIPKSVQEYFPVDKKRYFKPLILKILKPFVKLFVKMKPTCWGFYKNNKLISTLFLNSTDDSSSSYDLELLIDPNHKEMTETFLTFGLSKIRDIAKPEDTITTTIRTSDGFTRQVFESFNFEIYERVFLMVEKIE